MRSLFPMITELWPRDGEAAAATTATAAAATTESTTTATATGLLTGVVETASATATTATATESTATVATTTAAATTAPAVEILDKFKVLDATGAVDHKATLAKYHASYAALEKRVGTGDLPPADITGYTIDPKHEIPPEQEQAIRAKFLADGLTAKQASSILDLYSEMIERAVQTQELETTNAVAALKTEWGTNYQAKLNSANYALAVIGGAELAKEIAENPELTNNASLLRLLAKAGDYIREDRTADQITTGETEELNSLVRSAAYTDPSNPDHQRIVNKVRSAMQRGWKPTF